MRASILITVTLGLMVADSALAITPEELPPGVPRTIHPDGQVAVDDGFTTRAFQQEALRLVIREANQGARDLHLPEKLPIGRTDIVHAFVGPFGFTFSTGGVGNITTSNHWYGVERGHKLSQVTVAHWEERCVEYRETCQLPASKVDTNLALRLATKWLKDFKVDVRALNRDCLAHAELSSYWNGFENGGHLKKPTFVPLYNVWWVPRSNPTNGLSVAYVDLFAPTKTLLGLTVRDAKYILRPPVVFTNLAALFPGTVVIKTNHAGGAVTIDGSKPFNPFTK